MAILIGEDLDLNAVSRILNLPAPSADEEPIRKVDFESALAGLKWKSPSARAASTSNVDLATPGASIDGVSLTSGDRVLLKDQADASENGIYVWTGAATPLTRSTDADTADELEAAVISVEEGTSNADTAWRQTEVNFTLETDDIAWTALGTSVPDAAEGVKGKIAIATQATTDTGTNDTEAVTPLKLATTALRGRGKVQTIGTGSTDQFDVTHNWGTYYVQADVFETTGDRRKVICGISMPDNNTVRINASYNIASGAWVVHLRELPTS